LVRFRIYGSSYVVLERSNGEALLRSPLLPGHLACRSRILSIRLNALRDECYARSADPHGHHRFFLQVADGDPLAISPSYPTREDCERAIEAVRRGAPGAFVMHAPIGEYDLDDDDPLRVVRDADKSSASDSQDDDEPTGASGKSE
jgi:uncharacterized protein YegP (UPF0339 family)